MLEVCRGTGGGELCERLASSRAKADGSGAGSGTGRKASRGGESCSESFQGPSLVIGSSSKPPEEKARGSGELNGEPYRLDGSCGSSAVSGAHGSRGDPGGGEQVPREEGTEGHSEANPAPAALGCLTGDRMKEVGRVEVLEPVVQESTVFPLHAALNVDELCKDAK